MIATNIVSPRVIEAYSTGIDSKRRITIVTTMNIMGKDLSFIETRLEG